MITYPQFRDQIEKHFNISELKDLCFDLQIQYESLPHDSSNDMARELIKYCKRHGRLDELIETCRRLRPHVSWEEPNSQNKLSYSSKALSKQAQYQIALHWADNGRKESLYGFNLRDCVLWGLDLERADLRNADLRDTDLGQANLQKANLGGADLRGANLFNTYLHGAKVNKSTKLDNKVQLVLDIIQVDGGVKHQNLQRVDLSNAILVWGELSYANLSGANLTGSSLVSARLIGTDLSEANLSEANLNMANLQESILINATLRQTNLLEANLSKADLRGADLSNARLIYDNSTADSVFQLNMSDSIYDDKTIWPSNFNPDQWGAIYVK